MTKLITNKRKQQHVSDHTEKATRAMKKQTSRKLRNEEKDIISEELTNQHRPVPGIDKLTMRKRSGYCPICLGKLKKNERNTRYENQCRHCKAVLQKSWNCQSCNTSRVWVGGMGARCKGCGMEQK